MENEDKILTGRNLNEAKDKVKDEEVAKVLRDAQEQLNKKVQEKNVRTAEEKKDVLRESAEKIKKEREKEAKLAKEREAKAREEERLAKEKAAKEKKEAEMRAAKEKEAKEREEARLAKERESKAREEERLAKEKAAKEKKEAEMRAAKEKEAKERETRLAKERAAKKPKEKGVKGTETGEKLEKREDTKEKSLDLDDNIYVDNSLKPIEVVKDKITIGHVIGTILEGIWTIVKLAVVICIVTAVAGFLLSRNMMIRGRNGNRQCLAGMTVSGAVSTNKSNEDRKVKDWLTKVKREKLTLEADDKSILVARQVVTDAANDKWVVILHGYNGNMEDIYDIAMHYDEEGYNILMLDLRGNGESEGSFLGMGWLDRLDVINWMDVILETNPSAEIVIHGIDMGADTALMLSGEPIKSSVKAIVAEGAYNNAWEVTKKEYKTRYEKWPVFPFLHMINPVMKVWAGYSLKEADAVKQVKKTSVPILLIRGQNDTYVTEDMTKDLDQAIASPHEVLIITTGTHEDCRYAEPDTYYNKIFDFIGGYIN